MKINLQALAIGAAILSLNSSSTVGQIFSSTDVSNNRAIAASPRAREEFPWLNREAAGVSAGKAASKADTVRHGKFLAAPRVLKEFPELARSIQPAKASGSTVPLLLRNRAFAASPRAQEEFPWLSRGNFSDASFQIAPVK